MIVFYGVGTFLIPFNHVRSCTMVWLLRCTIMTALLVQNFPNAHDIHFIFGPQCYHSIAQLTSLTSNITAVNATQREHGLMKNTLNKFWRIIIYQFTGSQNVITSVHSNIKVWVSKVVIFRVVGNIFALSQLSLIFVALSKHVWEND